MFVLYFSPTQNKSYLVSSCLNFQFSNALRKTEMVPVLKKLKVEIWTIRAQCIDLKLIIAEANKTKRSNLRTLPTFSES